MIIKVLQQRPPSFIILLQCSPAPNNNQHVLGPCNGDIHAPLVHQKANMLPTIKLDINSLTFLINRDRHRSHAWENNYAFFTALLRVYCVDLDNFFIKAEPGCPGTILLLEIREEGLYLNNLAAIGSNYRYWLF